MAELSQEETQRTASDGWPVPWIPVEGTRGGMLAWLEYIAMRSATRCAARLPEFLLTPLIGGFARLAKLVDRRHSQAARGFIRQALGKDMDEAELEERVLQAYRHLIGITIRAEGWSRRVSLENWREHCTIDVSPEFLALTEKGSILICPHVGDWEAGVGFLPLMGFNPLYAIARPPKNLPLSRYLQRTREARGFRVLPRRGGIQLASEVVGGGGTLCLLIDQRARDRGVLVPFFGRAALCDRSAGVLLKRLGVPIAVGAIYLTDKPYHFRVSAHTVLHPEDYAGHSVEQIIERINRELEERILEAPEQYFWLHERYRGAPEPEEG
jgi:KDO2-lipid IV(A) lauroyltransferase